MRCPFCGQDNPAQYRFCGMCGKAMTPSTPADAKESTSLRETPVVVPSSRVNGERLREESSRQDASRNEEVPFTGPSFLGLSSGPSSEHAEYLLDDEASSSGHGRMYLALILLVIAGGLLGWRWYYGGFPWQQRSSAPAATTTAQTNNTANPPAVPNSQTTAPPASTPATTPSAGASNQANTQNPPAPNATTPPAAESEEKTTTNPSADASSTGASSTETPSSPDSSSPDSAAASSATTGKADSEPSQQSQKQNAPTAEAKKTAPAKSGSARTAKRPVDRAAMSEEDSSASEGNALLTQGERYLYGNGVPQNCGRAQSSLEAAADHGNSRALSDLATMYSTGHCVRRDLPTAYRWFVKALHQQPSNNRISTDLQVLWNQMTPEEKQAAMKER